MVNDPSPDASASSVINKLQTSINFWEESLRASGGALVPSKCHWYLVNYSWSGNKWQLLSSNQVPGDISIRSPSGRRVSIERVDPHMARKTLGIWTAPDGSMTAELDYLKSKVKAWVDKVRVRHLPHHLVWQSLRTGIFKTLEYPLAATTFTSLQCRELCAPLLQVGLSRSHIVRSMPRDVVYGPRTVGGFSLPNLFVEQGLAHVSAFLLFGRSATSITGCLLRASFEYLHLEVGTSICPLQLPFLPWSACAVPSWAKTLWAFCAEYQISLPSVVSPPPPPLLRAGDKFLMDAFWDSGIRSGQTLAQLNRCRLFLRVFSLADIVSCDGRTVLAQAWSGSDPCGRRPRSDTWPSSPPHSALAWPLWQRCLMSVFGADSRFRSVTTTLGNWDYATVRSTLPLFCPTLDRLFIPTNDDCWAVYGVLPTRRGRRRFHGPLDHVAYGSLLLQPSLFPADVIHHPQWVSLQGYDTRPLPLPVPIGRSLRPPQPDLRASELAPFTQTWFDAPDDPSVYDSLLRAASVGALAAVSDGSANAGVDGTAAWCIAFDATTVSHLSAGLRIPGPADAQCSFRSELAGLLAIAKVLRSVLRFFPLFTGTVHFGTDSQAVIDRIFTYPRQPSLRDHSWDLVSLTRSTIDAIPNLQWKTRHIKGHQDCLDGPLDIWAKRNIAADERAALVYIRVPVEDIPTFPPAPLPPVMLGTTPVVHNLAVHLRHHVLAPPLLDFWSKLGRFGNCSSSAVAWPSYAQALDRIPQSRRHWVLKATAGRSAVGVEMVRRRAWRTPVCPRCNRHIETTEHVFSCPHSDAIDLWAQRLTSLHQWLLARNTQPEAMQVIITALSDFSQQRPIDPSLRTTVPFLAQAARTQAELGWGAAIFGFWAPEWAEVQDVYFRFLGKRNSGRRWLALLIAKVWDVAWDLWEHRNGIFHAAEAARLMAERHDAIRSAYASPPPSLSPALRLLFRRPLASRLSDPPRIQDLFLRRLAQHRSSAPVRRLRVQQRRFRQLFRPPGPP